MSDKITTIVDADDLDRLLKYTGSSLFAANADKDTQAFYRLGAAVAAARDAEMMAAAQSASIERKFIIKWNSDKGQKIPAIKFVREWCGYGLKEGIEVVENFHPITVPEAHIAKFEAFAHQSKYSMLEIVEV